MVIGYQPVVDTIGAIRRRIEQSSKEEKGHNPIYEPLATFTDIPEPLIATAAKFRAKHGACYRLC